MQFSRDHSQTFGLAWEILEETPEMAKEALPWDVPSGEPFDKFIDFLVAKAEGIHLFPSRTQSLSLPAVMVLLQTAVGE